MVALYGVSEIKPFIVPFIYSKARYENTAASRRPVGRTTLGMESTLVRVAWRRTVHAI